MFVNDSRLSSAEKRDKTKHRPLKSCNDKCLRGRPRPLVSHAICSFPGRAPLSLYAPSAFLYITSVKVQSSSPSKCKVCQNLAFGWCPVTAFRQSHLHHTCICLISLRLCFFFGIHTDSCACFPISASTLVPNSASMKLLQPAELDSRSTDPDPTSTEQPR